MSGFLLNTDQKNSDTSWSEPTCHFSTNISGAYQVLHTDVEDGNIPIIWSANNILHVTRESDSSDWVVTFPDLSADDITSLSDYFTAALEADLTFLTPSSTVFETFDDGATYKITFSEDLTFNLSSGSSSMRQVLHDQDISTDSSILYIDGTHLDARPHLLAIDIQQASDKMALTGYNYANLIISTRDDTLIGHYISIPDAVSDISFKVYRLNVPGHVVPLELGIKIVFQRPILLGGAA